MADRRLTKHEARVRVEVIRASGVVLVVALTQLLPLLFASPQ